MTTKTTTATDRETIWEERIASKCSLQKQNKSVDSTSQIMSHKVQITIFICFCACDEKQQGEYEERMVRQRQPLVEMRLHSNTTILFNLSTMHFIAVLCPMLTSNGVKMRKIKNLFFVITFDSCTNHHH